ncbi:hypothetical protein [Corynebacterium aquatimens]|uniref:hypothetical protein n=1 Tax=Corynebacterium aquatimens TaxID=1190508 RepID=UPI002540B800|nr:hypothetical protein [Corynebacterium aquatimens]
MEQPEPPVVREAAESLRAVAGTAGEVRGVDTAAGIVGAAGIGVVAYALAPLPVALTVSGLSLVVLAALSRSTQLFAPAPFALGAAAGTWVAGPPSAWISAVDPALGALAGVLTAAAGVGAGAMLGLATPATVTFVLASCVTAGVSALGAWLPATTAPAALAALASILVVMATPGAATRAAGLQVPRIPTAGEDFDTADGYQMDVDARSVRAVAIAGSMSLAAAACTIPALTALGWHADAWVAVFGLCTAGAFGLHALRQHYPTARAALAAAALAAVICAAVATARTSASHPALIAVATLGATAAAAAPLWAPRLSELEPTTVVWFERAEMAAIIAVIPLAVHLTGLFALIRGCNHAYVPPCRPD